MTVATKLHILLITTILGVGLYMFLLYKEIRMFERELADLRIKVQSVASQMPPTTGQIMDVVDSKSVCPMRSTIGEHVASQIAVIADNNDDPSDDMSVTSNEIKEILTNIQDIHEDATPDHDLPPTPTTDVPDQTEVSAPTQAPTPIPTPLAPVVTVLKKTVEPVNLETWHTLSDEQINAMKYDDLRNIIRKRGVNIKGTKQELCNMVLSIKKELNN